MSLRHIPDHVRGQAELSRDRSVEVIESTGARHALPDRFECSPQAEASHGQGLWVLVGTVEGLLERTAPRSLNIDAELRKAARCSIDGGPIIRHPTTISIAEGKCNRDAQASFVIVISIQVEPSSVESA
jgi:hypothetical protein